MDKLENVLADSLQKLSEQIASMGPDAERVYSEMVGMVYVQGLIGLIIWSIGIILVGVILISIVLYIKNEKNRCEATYFVFAISCMVFLFFCIAGVAGFSDWISKIMYPEGTLIRSFLQ